MNTSKRDYTKLLTSDVQHQFKSLTYDVWVRREFVNVTNGVVSVSYWNTARDVSISLAVEIGGNWLEDQFPDAPYLGYHRGEALETRFIHRRDERYNGIRFPFIIIKPHDPLAGESIVYLWKGDEFEVV